MKCKNGHNYEDMFAESQKQMPPKSRSVLESATYAICPICDTPVTIEEKDYNQLPSPQEDWEEIKTYLDKWKYDPESNYSDKEKWFKKLFEDIFFSYEQKIREEERERIRNILEDFENSLNNDGKILLRKYKKQFEEILPMLWEVLLEE